MAMGVARLYPRGGSCHPIDSPLLNSPNLDKKKTKCSLKEP